MINTAKIPEELRTRPQWVVWRYETRDGKDRKVPVNPSTDTWASSTDPGTWANFDTALANQDSNAGIGYVFSADDPFTGIDFDGCYHSDTHEVAPWAKSWIAKLNSYSELSPSKTGVKVWVKAKWPLPTGKKIAVDAPEFVPGKEPGIEAYDHARFFAVTGMRLSSLPAEPQERQSEIDELCATFFSMDTKRESTDRETSSRLSVIERARKYLDTLPGAVSGSGGHNATYRAACILVLGFGLTKPEALILLSDYNRRCEPPWTEKELRHKIDSADKQPGERGYLRDKDENEWKNTKIPDYREPAQESRIVQWPVYDASELYSWPNEQLEWVVESIIPKGGIGFMSAPPKDRKSLLTLDLAAHIAQPEKSLNRHLWLGRFKVSSARILYIAREDPLRRVKDRMIEICCGYGMPLPAPQQLQFLVRERIHLTDEVHLAWLKTQVAERGIDFLILDVLNRMVPDLDELSAKDMAKVVTILEELNRDFGLTVLCDDHTRKPQGKNIGRDTQEPNPFDLKGSIAKYGCADFMICLSRTQQENRMQVYVENKDADNRPHFLLDISPKDSGQPKFTFAGDVERLASEAKQKGEANRERVFQATPADRWASRVEIQKAVGMEESTVLEHLRKLRDAGRIEKTGSGKTVRYRKSPKEGENPFRENGATS